MRCLVNCQVSRIGKIMRAIYLYIYIIIFTKYMTQNYYTNLALGDCGLLRAQVCENLRGIFSTHGMV